MVSPAVGQNLGSEAVTEGVRVRVAPRYLADQSDPPRGQYIFAYRVTISNEGESPVRLLSRHWIITDSEGVIEEIAGDGVIGEQPILQPGDSHEYESFCPLETEWGTMEGTYTMERDGGGATFEAQVARFYLATTQE